MSEVQTNDQTWSVDPAFSKSPKRTKLVSEHTARTEREGNLASQQSG